MGKFCVEPENLNVGRAIALVNEKGSRKISSRTCCVYGSKMARKSLLVLARQHNDVNEIQRKTTFSEIAATCRRLAFSQTMVTICLTYHDTTLIFTRIIKRSALLTFTVHNWLVRLTVVNPNFNIEQGIH